MALRRREGGGDACRAGAAVRRSPQSDTQWKAQFLDGAAGGVRQGQEQSDGFERGFEDCMQRSTRVSDAPTRSRCRSRGTIRLTLDLKPRPPPCTGITGVERRRDWTDEEEAGDRGGELRRWGCDFRRGSPSRSATAAALRVAMSSQARGCPASLRRSGSLHTGDNRSRPSRRGGGSLLRWRCNPRRCLQFPPAEHTHTLRSRGGIGLWHRALLERNVALSPKKGIHGYERREEQQELDGINRDVTRGSSERGSVPHASYDIPDDAPECD